MADRAFGFFFVAAGGLCTAFGELYGSLFGARKLDSEGATLSRAGGFLVLMAGTLLAGLADTTGQTIQVTLPGGHQLVASTQGMMPGLRIWYVIGATLVVLGSLALLGRYFKKSPSSSVDVVAAEPALCDQDEGADSANRKENLPQPQQVLADSDKPETRIKEKVRKGESQGQKEPTTPGK